MLSKLDLSQEQTVHSKSSILSNSFESRPIRKVNQLSLRFPSPDQYHYGSEYRRATHRDHARQASGISFAIYGS